MARGNEARSAATRTQRARPGFMGAHKSNGALKEWLTRSVYHAALTPCGLEDAEMRDIIHMPSFQTRHYELHIQIAFPVQ